MQPSSRRHDEEDHRIWLLSAEAATAKSSLPQFRGGQANSAGHRCKQQTRPNYQTVPPINSAASNGSISSTTIHHHLSDLQKNNPPHWGRPPASMKHVTGLAKYVNLRWLGVCLFILASLYCVYEILQLDGHNGRSHSNNGFQYVTKLRLVSVIQRHGDRAPSDAIPETDPHKQVADRVWPNGQSNLTDAGKFRLFRIGLELRHRYEHLLDYNASHVLAFSSPIFRCRESASYLLQGLFNIEQTLEQGRLFASRVNCSSTSASGGGSHNDSKPLGICEASGRLPGGSGFQDEWRRVNIDTKTIPSLTYGFLNNCPFWKANPPPMDSNLRLSENINKLPGIGQLEELLAERYAQKLNFSALGLWSTIGNELRLARTSPPAGSLQWGAHFYDWINRPVNDERNQLTIQQQKTVALQSRSANKAALAQAAEKVPPIGLFDLYEQVCVYSYRDRLQGDAKYIQTTQILDSLLKSQLIALERHQQAGGTANQSVAATTAAVTESEVELYTDKRLILYSSHDSIVQKIMFEFNMIQIEEHLSLAQRINKWRTHDSESKFRAGFKMSEFGVSLALELYEVERKPPPSTSPQSLRSSGGKARSSGGGHDPSLPDGRPPPNKHLAYVQAALYNQEDGKLKPVVYKRLPFGSLCRQAFERKLREEQRFAINKTMAAANAKSNKLLLENYFQKDSFPQLDARLSCPFELFRHLYGESPEYKLNSTRIQQLCSTNVATDSHTTN